MKLDTHADTTPAPRPGVITVRGTGRATVPPDVIDIHFDVRAHRRDYAAAVERLNEKVAHLRDAVASASVDLSRVKTTDFNVSIRRTQRGNNYYNDGFDASHQVHVQLPVDTNLCNRVLTVVCDGRIAAEFRLAFRVQDPRPLRRMILTDATRNARADAEAIAQAAGCRLGAIRSISYSWSEHRFDVLGMEEPMTAMTCQMPSIEPDDIRATDTVEVMWEVFEGREAA